MKDDKKEQAAIKYLEEKGYGIIVRRKKLIDPNFVFIIKTIATNGRFHFQIRKSKPSTTSILNEEYAKVDIRELKWIKMRRL